MRGRGAKSLTAAGLLCLALAACDRPGPSAWLKHSCAARAGAWRYGQAKADVVLLTFNLDPLQRPDSAPASRAEGPPCLACAKAMLDRGLRAVEFPVLDPTRLDRVGRLSLQPEGVAGCDAFRQNTETIMSAKYYDLHPPAGSCIALQADAPRSARYAVASFARTSDKAQVVELVDLQSRSVLARVVDFQEIPETDAAEAAIPWRCRDTPSGAPANNPTSYVLSSLQTPVKASR
jgi:hypothetical protein